MSKVYKLNEDEDKWEEAAPVYIAPTQTPQSTFGEKLQEAMYQNVQITALGNFPEAVPDHKNWVNIMGKVFSLDFNQASAAIKALVLEEVEAQKPTHIMGKSLEEVMQILSALKLERIADMQMTMERLSEWMELVREDHRKAVQKSLDKTMEQFTQLSIITKGE